jgi:kumamolisin
VSPKARVFASPGQKGNMSSPKDRISLRGSVRAPLPGARAVGAANPDQPIEVTVLLRPRAAKQSLKLEELGARPPRERKPLTREELGSNSGAAPQDIASIEAFAHDHQLAVVEANAAERRVVLCAFRYGSKLQQGR